MFNKRNHVGRPTNEELRKKRNRKLLMVTAPIVLVLLVITLIATGSLSKLSGNSVISYYCEDASYALEGENCIKTIAKKSSLLADVNSDDVIDNNDLVTLNKYVQDNNSVSLNEKQLKVADINHDGMINETDVQILEGYFTKIAGTYSEYQEQIGVERLCEDGYNLNGVNCLKKESIPASKKESTQDNGSSNTNTSNNTNNTNNTNNNNQNINNNNSTTTTNTNTNTNSVNSNSQNSDSPVIATFKPENNKTVINVNTKYKMNVNFDVKDSTQQYYYIWTNYLYGEENYNTGCQKVSPGEHYGSFTMNGTRKANVTVYSDASCKNKVTSVDSKKYTCKGCTNMVDVTLKPQDNKTSFTKGTKYKMNVVFNIKDKENTYYYIWSNYTNGINNYNTNCTKVTEGEHNGSFTIDGTKKVNLTLYSDASCKTKIKSVASKKYTCSNCIPVKVSIGNNLPALQTNGTVIHNGIVFNVIDKENTYYYRWRTYSNNSSVPHFEGNCSKVPTNGKEQVKDLTINSSLKVRKGTITVYSDNKCSKKVESVPVASTTTYKCSNCNVNNNSSNNTNYNTSGSSNSKKSNSSGSSNGTKGKTCIRRGCPDGWQPWGNECRHIYITHEFGKVCKTCKKASDLKCGNGETAAWNGKGFFCIKEVYKIEKKPVGCLEWK